MLEKLDRVDLVKLSRNLRSKIEREETGEIKRTDCVEDKSWSAMPRLESRGREQINPEEDGAIIMVVQQATMLALAPYCPWICPLLLHQACHRYTWPSAFPNEC